MSRCAKHNSIREERIVDKIVVDAHQ